jgi:predicted ATP-grasp superfamily ATP-dependent carboligase
MKQKVVIIGYGFDTRLFLARLLGELGYEVSIIALNITKSKPIDWYSKYVQHYYYTQGDNEDKLLHILLNECKQPGQKVILIPINDFSASVLDRNL